MKKLFTALLLLFSVKSSFSQAPEFPAFSNADTLLQRLKITSEKIYCSSTNKKDAVLIKTSGFTNQGKLSSSTFYSDKGILLGSQSSEYSADGRFLKTHTVLFKKIETDYFVDHAFDSLGRSVKTIVIQVPPHDTTVYTQVYSDSLTETTVSLPHGKTFVATKEFLAGDKLLKKENYNGFGALTFLEEYDYNSDSSIVTTTLSYAGRKYFKGKVVYDLQGRIIEVTVATIPEKDGVVNEKWNRKHPPKMFFYFYNSDGSLAQRTYTDKKGVTWIEKRYYTK